MNITTQGSYTIEQQDNILLVDARGPFDIEVLEKFRQEMYGVCEKFEGQSWGSLVTYYGNGVFTPEAEEALIEITKYREAKGMVANASVILNSSHADLQQMQLRRIYQSTKITFHVFSNIDSASEWLTEFVNQKRPDKIVQYSSVRRRL